MSQRPFCTFIASIAAFLSLAASAQGQAPAAADLHPRVVVETSRGNFVIELDAERAPLTVANFLQYMRDGHYDRTLFHRVIANFVVQGGGFAEDFSERKPRAPIPNESGNGLSNRRGTIGLARQGPPHTGTAQWFINLADNNGLDPLPSRWGYAVFGRVVEGMEVVDAIGLTPTGAGGPFGAEVPQEKVLVKRIALAGAAPAPDAPAAPPATPAPPATDAPPPSPQ
jgi:peptidyl-prolyl cis-trans isomerase A (cyclophilin A)